MSNIQEIKPYVYLLIHKQTKKLYVGFRCKNVRLNKRPLDDIGVHYFTSSKRINKSNFSEYDAIILRTFEDKISAWRFEQKIISQQWTNPKLINVKRRLDVDGSVVGLEASTKPRPKRVFTEKHRHNLSLAMKGKVKVRSESGKRSYKEKRQIVSDFARERWKAGQQKRFNDPTTRAQQRHNMRLAGAKGLETRLKNFKSLVVTFPSGEIKNYKRVGEFAKPLGVSSASVAHLARPNKRNKKVESGRFKDFIFEFVEKNALAPIVQ